MNRYRKPEDRSLLAFTLAMDPSMKEQLQRFFSMGARDIHPDYMYVRRPVTGIGHSHDRIDDPGAWNATLPSRFGGSNLHVSLLRGRDGKWFLHGS